MKRLERTGKLFGFLRVYRSELFDEGFQAKLAEMYPQPNSGKEPLPPAMLAMVVLLQAYTGTSDAEAVELSVVDLRWQMVLDCLGTEKPAFSQGALQAFRERLIKHDMDRSLLERTAELARKTRGFDATKLPRALAIDSSPLEGAGRVEDTINLIAHAARKVVECAALLLNIEYQEVCKEAGIPLLLESSPKKALDRDWANPKEKARATEDLMAQVFALQGWVDEHLTIESTTPPLSEKLQTLQEVIDQDLEPDPSGGIKIKKGVAKERRISITDSQMRHGRKSKNRPINGYKRHLAIDLDSGVIAACALTPANRPEEEATPDLERDLARQNLKIRELYIDRGYTDSSISLEVLAQGGQVVCRPRSAYNFGLYTKDDFDINLAEKTVRCPAGIVIPIRRRDNTVRFSANECNSCSQKKSCTSDKNTKGRCIAIAPDEAFQQTLKEFVATSDGRQKLRRRTSVEHKLARLVRGQGRKARYVGCRKNLADIRRHAAVMNLEIIHREKVS